MTPGMRQWFFLNSRHGLLPTLKAHQVGSSLLLFGVSVFPYSSTLSRSSENIFSTGFPDERQNRSFWSVSNGFENYQITEGSFLHYSLLGKF